METKRYLELDENEKHIIVNTLNELRTSWLNENDILFIDVLENILNKLYESDEITITNKEYCLLVNVLNKKRLELEKNKEDTTELEDLLLKIIDSPKTREMVFVRDEAR